MARKTDFPEQRRLHGRSLSSALREIVGVAKTDAEIRKLLDDAKARRSEERRGLAERLQESVTPLFIADDRGRPTGIGTCVLVSLNSEFFAFTAAHVIRDAGSSRLWAPSKNEGGGLLELPQCTAHLRPSIRRDDLDVRVLAL